MEDAKDAKVLQYPHVIAMAFDLFTSIGLVSLRG
jgi:hypothetical protein